jgi:hypothetical protein
MSNLPDEDPLAALERLNNEIHPTTAIRSPAKLAKPALAPAFGEDDPLAKLESHLKATPHSRPNTPKLARTSEERKARRSADSASTPLQHELTPTSEDSAAAREQQEDQQQGAGGGWWGGIFATATKVRQQAELAVKEMGRSEEAAKWADQVKGNVHVLRGFGEFCLLFVLCWRGLTNDTL